MSLGAMASTRSSDIGRKQRTKGSSATAQLEVESRRMEERLRVLKQMMSAEKARREVEGGYLWESGQKGPLLLRNKDQSPVSNVKTTAVANGNGGQRQRNKERIKVRILTDKNEANPPSGAVRCGQCDKSTASLSCVECVENYCQLCYAKFHQKGALAQHHAKPLVSKSKIRKISPQKQACTVEASSKSTSSTTSNDSGHPPPSTPNENSLLSGSYDEEESAASFQQALAEWRAAGKTTNTAQAYTTKDFSTNSMSSAGIQAGPAGGVAAATDKGRQQIQFSGKSGVSYFEQLMMKRHRYDPMCLSRAAAHVHTTPTDRVDIALESNNDGGLPADEGTLSNYNIFYDVEPAESSLPHNDIEEHISTPPPSAPGSSSVEIVELDVCQLSTSSARADDVKIHPIELGETSPKPVAVVKPRSSKSSEATRTRPKSTNKKRQIQSSRLKYKSKPRSTHHASPKAPSDVTESDIQSSVKKAWSNCSEQPQLTRFFLQGVEADDNKVDRKAKSQAAETAYKVTVSKLSSTIWLPGNSVSSTNTNLDAFEINPATDLPPAETHRPKSPNQSPPLAGPPNSGDAPASESDNEELAELELSVSNVEEGEITWTERQERDEQDEETLESLAWELASTVECEGRLTRCQSEMDKLDSEIGDASSQREQGLGGEEEAFVLSDLSQVMSEFELYQQSVMEQDSD